MFDFDFYYWVNLANELEAARNRDMTGDEAVRSVPKRSHTAWFRSFVLARRVLARWIIGRQNTKRNPDSPSRSSEK